MNRDFGKKTKGCFSSKARFSAVTDAFCSSKEIVTAHRVHGVCPARLAAFFSEERGCAALRSSIVAIKCFGIVASCHSSEVGDVPKCIQEFSCIRRSNRNGDTMSVSSSPKYQIKVPNKAKYQTKHQTTRFLVCCFKHSGLCKGNCII